MYTIDNLFISLYINCMYLFIKVPVACKACPCGHSFFNARRNSIKSPPSPDNGVMKTRRTNRIKREKPNYYDALEYDKQSKKSAKVRYSLIFYT